MKKKKVFLNLNFCRIFSLVLAVFLCASSLLFSGCFEDEKEEAGKTFFERYVDGVSTVYADMAGQQVGGLTQDDTQNMLGEIRLGLLANYGNGQNSTYFYGSASFPDSIRMLVYQGTENKAERLDKKWRWTLVDPMKDSSDMEVNKIENLKPKENELYSDWSNRVLGKTNGVAQTQTINIEAYAFPTEMNNMLQVVLYEIMLGYEYDVDASKNQVSTLRVELSTEDPKYSIVPTFRGSNKGESVEAYLEKLKAEYMKNTRYTGLTKQNADKLIDYILHEIIGAELVVYDYKTFTNQPVNYRNYVSTIAYLIYSQTFDGKDEDWVYTFTSGETEISYTFSETERQKAVYNGLLGEKQEGEMSAQNAKQEGGFTAKAATYVKYFEGEKFFGSAEEGVVDQFAEAGAPYAEYQSVVVVPKKSLTNLVDGGLKLESGFVYSFMSKNKDLRIRTTIRVKLQNDNGDWFLYEFDGAEVNFSSASSFVNEAGETCYEDTFDFGINSSALDRSLVKISKDKTGYESKSFTVGFFDEDLVDDLNNVGNENNLGIDKNKNIQNLYKVVASKNGYGALTVLDEEKADFSFYEICFDVVKSPNNPEGTDYKFSMVLSNTGLWPGIC